jgi:hypothetical protein
MRHQPINDDAVRSSEARTATGPLAGESAELLFELAWYHHREDKPQ